MTSPQYSIIKLHGKEITPRLRQIAELRIEIFREFPYLYDGTLEYEEKYLQTYLHSPDSIAILVIDNNEVVGASTGLPLEDETGEFQKPFLDQGYNPKNVFYCGESILKKAYRGRGIYTSFMNAREQYARQLGRFTTICFCGVVRPEAHPLRPDNYQPLDPVWKKFGYTRHPSLKTSYRWKDLMENEETEKEMVFWLKKLD